MYNSKHNILILNLFKWSNWVMMSGGAISALLLLIGFYTASEGERGVGLYIIISAIILLLFCWFISVMLEVKATQLELLSGILNKKSEDKN